MPSAGQVDAAAATEALLRERASEAEHAMEQLRQARRSPARGRQRPERQAGFDETSALRARVQTQLKKEMQNGGCGAPLLETVEEARQRIEVIQAAAHAEIQAVQAEARARPSKSANRTLEADAQLRALAGQRRSRAPRPRRGPGALDGVRRGTRRGDRGRDHRARRLRDAGAVHAREFARVALFMVRHNRLEGWCGRGFDRTIDIENIVVPLAIASPLTRAFTDRTPATLAAGADGITVGLFGGAVAWAMALPRSTRGAVAVSKRPEEARSAAQCGDSHQSCEPVHRRQAVG